MSMENAILAHAAALTALAGAIEKALGGGWTPVQTVAGGGEKIKGTFELAETETAKGSTGKGKIEPAADETRAIDKAELDKAVADAKAAAADATLDADAEALDYNKDVKPRLLAVVKKVGKEKLGELVASFGAKRADEVDPAKFAELLTKAEALEK